MSDSDLTALIAEALREKSSPGHKGQPGTKDDGQLWGAFPNSMTLDDLAAHVASVLSGVYAITPLPEKPVRFGHHFVGSDPECCCAGVGGGELCGYPKWEHTASTQETPQ